MDEDRLMSTTTTTQAVEPARRGNLRGLLKTMRPRQWVKSIIVFAALVFDGKLFVPELFLKTTLIFFCFLPALVRVYILNDLVDMEKDRQHPRKRMRPLASGQLDPRLAACRGDLWRL